MKLYKAITISLVLIALATLVTTSTMQVARAEEAIAPNEDGSCVEGAHMTPAGFCCPDGTENAHSFCRTP